MTTENHDRLALYVHIPFCHTKCGYCDFNSYAMKGEIVGAFVDALHREIKNSLWEGARVPTVFFGGGTPTFLTGEELAAILEHLSTKFRIDPDAEITSEANPGTVDLHKLRLMRQAGFNRISFGVQSFDAVELKRMERIHSPEEVMQAVRTAREAGFDNLNLDLIYALPDQTLERWQNNLKQAIELNPEHLALYGLMLEPNTRFYHLYQKGQLALPEDEVQVAMYELARDFAGQQGYEQYEISNYAKPGYACRHNLVYWRNEPYLGFGPGAVCYVEGRRWMNMRHPREYIRRVCAGEPLEFESECIAGWESVAETLMLGLRTREGMDLEALQNRYDLPVKTYFRATIDKLIQRGWLLQEGTRIVLTREGFLWHSEASLAFFEEIQ
jgi:oxygen-independent coproporphyrinogen-3 oxidase